MGLFIGFCYYNVSSSGENVHNCWQYAEGGVLYTQNRGAILLYGFTLMSLCSSFRPLPHRYV